MANGSIALLESRDQYTFYVPRESRWANDPPSQDRMSATGSTTPSASSKRHNMDALQDVLEHINFNRKIGQRTLDDDTLVDFIQNFEKIPAARRELRVSRPARRRLRIPDQILCRLGRQEGGRVLHARRCRPHDGRDRRPASRA